MFSLEKVLTRSMVLNKISQENIFEKFFQEISLRKRYKNPLRSNNTPNSEFKYVEGVLLFIDYGWGDNNNVFDCFSFVKNYYNLNTYKEVYKYIYNNFEISKPKTKEKQNEDKKEKTLQSIKIKNKTFTQKELDFWKCNNKLELDESLLKTYNIYSTEYVWYNDKYYQSKEGVFAFVISDKVMQIYSPFQKDRRLRFRSNGLLDVVAFKHLLRKDKYVLITKSYKDAFLLQLLGFNACAFLNEGVKPSEALIKELQQFGKLILLLDNDITGITIARNICKKHDLKYFHFSIFESSKDSWDFLSLNDIDKLKNKINTMLTLEQRAALQLRKNEIKRDLEKDLGLMQRCNLEDELLSIDEELEEFIRVVNDNQEECIHCGS